MNKAILCFGLIPVAMLNACAQEPRDGNSIAPAEQATRGSGSTAAMDKMAGDEAGTAAKGTGTVTAVDSAARKITLDHGPIAEINWPAMTMSFDAPPEVLEGVAVGDKVQFDVAVKGSGGEVTAIRKQ